VAAGHNRPGGGAYAPATGVHPGPCRHRQNLGDITGRAIHRLRVYNRRLRHLSTSRRDRCAPRDAASTFPGDTAADRGVRRNYAPAKRPSRYGHPGAPARPAPGGRPGPGLGAGPLGRLNRLGRLHPSLAVGLMGGSVRWLTAQRRSGRHQREGRSLNRWTRSFFAYPSLAMPLVRQVLGRSHAQGTIFASIDAVCNIANLLLRPCRVYKSVRSRNFASCERHRSSTVERTGKADASR